MRALVKNEKGCNTVVELIEIEFNQTIKFKNSKVSGLYLLTGNKDLMFIPNVEQSKVDFLLKGLLTNGYIDLVHLGTCYYS